MFLSTRNFVSQTKQVVLAFVARDQRPLPAEQWPPEKVASRVPFPELTGDAGQCPLSCGASSEEIVTVIANACSVLSLCLPHPTWFRMLYFS